VKTWFEIKRELQCKRVARHLSNPRNRLKHNIRKGICGYVPKEFRDSQNRPGGRFNVEHFTGIAFERLCLIIERQFYEPMTWENYGWCWHLDHIVPLDYFDRTQESECLAAWNWRNLQPLLAAENLSKGWRTR
jgi:hypothetical protein